MTPIDFLLMFALGLLGGTIGGLLGLGGGVIVIPALTVAFGPDQHYYQASMMLVYIVTALPAAWRHHKAAAVRFDALRGLLPASMLLILLGVGLGNHFAEADLRRIFVLFLAYVIITDIIRLTHEFHRSRTQNEDTSSSTSKPSKNQAARQATNGGPTSEESQQARSPVPASRSIIVGACTGLVSGLLGVGGGVVAVPLLQRIAKMNLRQAIGTSTAVILVTGAVGAVAKVSTLAATTADSATPHSALDAIQLAAFLAPGAVLGGWLGASLTHRLPIPWVRTVFLILLTLSALEMSGLVSFTKLFGG